MEDKKKIILIVFAFFVVMIAIFLKAKKVEENKTDGEKFKEEYECLNEDHLSVSISKGNPIVYAEIEEIFDLLENKTGVIYFGFPECPWCRNAVPVLLEVAKEEGIDKVYYYNGYEDRDILSLDENNQIITKKEGTENYTKLLQLLDEHLSYYEVSNGEVTVTSSEKRLYFPTIVFVKEGKIKLVHVSTVESQTDPSIPLNEEQTEELKDIFRNGFSLLSDTCKKDKC